MSHRSRTTMNLNGLIEDEVYQFYYIQQLQKSYRAKYTMSFMKPTKSSQMRNDDSTKKRVVVKAGQTQQAAARKTIDRAAIGSSRPSREQLEQQDYLDTETTDALKTNEDGTRPISFVNESMRSSVLSQQAPRHQSSQQKQKADLVTQRALSSRLSQPKVIGVNSRRASRVSEVSKDSGQATMDKLNLSNKKVLKKVNSARNSITGLPGSTKNQLLQKHQQQNTPKANVVPSLTTAVNNEKNKTHVKNRGSICSESSLNNSNSKRQRQLQSSLRLSQGRPSTVMQSSKGAAAVAGAASGTGQQLQPERSKTKSALELQLEKIKTKTNQEYFKNAKGRSGTAMSATSSQRKQTSLAKPIKSSRELVQRNIRNQVVSATSSRSNSKLKNKVQELQQTFGRKISTNEVMTPKNGNASTKLSSPANKNEKNVTVNTSIFQTANEGSENNQDGYGPDGQFQTALLSSIMDDEEHQGNSQDTSPNKTEPFSESNMFRSNFEAPDHDDCEEVDFVIDGSTIINQEDGQCGTGQQSLQGDSFLFDQQNLILSPDKISMEKSLEENQERTSRLGSSNELTVEKIRRNKHARHSTIDKIGNVGPNIDSVIHLTKVNDFEEDQDADDDVQDNPFEFNGQCHQSNEDYCNRSDAQMTAFLGNSSSMQHEAPLNNSEAQNYKMDFKLRKSSFLQIQIDEVDSENENDNSYFNDNMIQMPNSMKSAQAKTFNYEEQLGGQKVQMTEKKNNGAKDSGDEFDLLQAVGQLKLDNDNNNSNEHHDSINTIAIVEESSENIDSKVNNTRNEGDNEKNKDDKESQQTKENSPIKKENNTDFDILTADFEVQSLNNRQDRMGLLAGSFAQLANQSIVENQPESNVNITKQIEQAQKAEALEDSPLESLRKPITSTFQRIGRSGNPNDQSSKGQPQTQSNFFNYYPRENRGSSYKRPAQRVDFSFQLDGSPERSNKIIVNTLSSSKFHSRESSLKKHEKGGQGGPSATTKPFDNGLFVVPETSEGRPTPKNNKKKQDAKYLNNSLSDLSSSLVIEQIKRMREEESDEKSRNMPTQQLRLSDKSKNSNKKKQKDSQGQMQSQHQAQQKQTQPSDSFANLIKNQKQQSNQTSQPDKKQNPILKSKIPQKQAFHLLEIEEVDQESSKVQTTDIEINDSSRIESKSRDNIQIPLELSLPKPPTDHAPQFPEPVPSSSTPAPTTSQGGMNDNLRLTLQEKILQRKKKLQEEEKNNGAIMSFKQNDDAFFGDKGMVFQQVKQLQQQQKAQEDEYQSPSFKPRSSIRQPKFFKFEDQNIGSSASKKEECPFEINIQNRNSFKQRNSGVGLSYRENSNRGSVVITGIDASKKHGIRVSKTKNQKFSMDSIPMNFVVGGSNNPEGIQNKNVSMLVDQKPGKLDESYNPFDDSQNKFLRTSMASAHESRGTHQIHNLAKFVDDQISNNQTNISYSNNMGSQVNNNDKVRSTVQTGNSAQKSQMHKRNLAIQVEDEKSDQKEKPAKQFDFHHDPVLKMQKIATDITPKNTRKTFNDDLDPNAQNNRNYDGKVAPKTFNMQELNLRLKVNSKNVNKNSSPQIQKQQKKIAAGGAQMAGVQKFGNNRTQNYKMGQNEKDTQQQQQHFDDTKSNYSRISKVSKFTNNLMNKSNNMINDQWYQFIYNYDDQCLDDDDGDDTVSMAKSQGGISRFTLNSKLSNAGQSNLSKISRLQNKYLNKNNANQQLNKQQNEVNRGGTAKSNQLNGANGNPTGQNQDQIINQVDRTPLDKLNDLLVTMDICRLIRINWLLGPMINKRAVKARIFNFLNYQVSIYIQKLDCPIKKAICHYLVDDLIDCIEVCKRCREQYLKQYAINRKKTTFDSYQMVKVFVIELTCHIELMREDQTTQQQRDALRLKAHSLLEEIPTVVKRRQFQHFTIIELILQYKEKIAYSKLKDLDFISYKLFKLERSISFQGESVKNGQLHDDISQLLMKEDDDEKKPPEEYCLEIQKQFNRIPTSEQIKKIEYYMYGALCAYRNHHYKEAWNFVSQAPFICNFGEQVPDVETLIVFEMLKMVELKLLTKIGRPEQAIIQLSNRFFQNKIIDDEQLNKLFPFSASQQNVLPFDTHIFLNQSWYLYKKIQYTCRLIEFRQDQLKFKMVSCIGQDFNQDAEALQKANDDLYNQMYHLLHIMKSLRYYEEKLKIRNRIIHFHWLLVKLLLRLEKCGKFQQMISNENFVGLFERLDVMGVISQLRQCWQPGMHGGLPEGQLAQVSKQRNKKMIEMFVSKYGKQPLLKTIHAIQSKLNHKFNKSGQAAQNNQKRQTNRGGKALKKNKFDDSKADYPADPMLHPDAIGRSLLDQSAQNDGGPYGREQQQQSWVNYKETEQEMLTKINKSQSQFFIQLQYLCDMVDKKLFDINFQCQREY